MEKVMTKKQYEHKKIEDKKRFYTFFIVIVLLTILSIVYMLFSKQFAEWASETAQGQSIPVLKGLISALPKICNTIVILIVSIFFICIGTIVANSLKPKTQRRKTNILLGESFYKYSIILVDFVLILKAWGANVESIVGATGGLVVVVGLCMQSIIQDFVCGIIMVFEGHVSVGESVSCMGTKATLKEIGTRVAILEDESNNILVVNNSHFTDFLNHSRYTTTTIVTIPTINTLKEEDFIKCFEDNKEKLQANCKEVIGDIAYCGIVSFDIEGTIYALSFDSNDEDVEIIKTKINSFFHAKLIENDWMV